MQLIAHLKPLRKGAPCEPLGRGAPCGDTLREVWIKRDHNHGRHAEIPAGYAAYFLPEPAQTGKQIVTWLFRSSGVYLNAPDAANSIKPASTTEKEAEKRYKDAARELNHANSAFHRTMAAYKAYSNKKPNGPKTPQLAADLGNAIKARNEAKNAKENARQAYKSTKSEFAPPDNSRPPLLSQLDATRASFAPNVQFDNSQLQTIENFVISLIVKVDTDPAVSKARLWLSVFRGPEQFSLFVLAFITVALMVIRATSFYHRRKELVQAVECINSLKLPPSNPGSQPTKPQLRSLFAERSDRLRAANLHTGPRKQEPCLLFSWDELRAALTHSSRLSKSRATNTHTGSEEGDALDNAAKQEVARFEITTDMVRAVLADLSQLRLYGLSDEKLEQVALDMKDKIATSRIIIDWCIAALPAIGFLGTVRGILNALSGVSGLTQGDAAARLQTLLQVSSSLGLAFATTLLALLFMLALSYFDVCQSRNERSLVDQFRDYLTEKALM